METGLYEHLTKLFLEIEIRLANRITGLIIEEINTSENKLEELLTDKELCKHLKISISHFYKIKKENKKFPVYDIFGAKRYKIVEIEQYFKQL